MQSSVPSLPRCWSLGATCSAVKEEPAAVSCHSPPLPALPAALLTGAKLGTGGESWKGGSWEGSGAGLVLTGMVGGWRRRGAEAGERNMLLQVLPL